MNPPPRVRAKDDDATTNGVCESNKKKLDSTTRTQGQHKLHKKSLLQQPGRKSLCCFHLNRFFKTDTEPLNMNLTTDLSSGPSLSMISVMRSVKKSEQPQLVTGRK
jgi:hypothetical protein